MRTTFGRAPDPASRWANAGDEMTATTKTISRNARRGRRRMDALPPFNELHGVSYFDQIQNLVNLSNVVTHRPLEDSAHRSRERHRREQLVQQPDAGPESAADEIVVSVPEQINETEIGTGGGNFRRQCRAACTGIDVGDEQVDGPCMSRRDTNGRTEIGSGERVVAVALQNRDSELPQNRVLHCDKNGLDHLPLEHSAASGWPSSASETHGR